jgi:hypothetical protein
MTVHHTPPPLLSPAGHIVDESDQMRNQPPNSTVNNQAEEHQKAGRSRCRPTTLASSHHAKISSRPHVLNKRFRRYISIDSGLANSVMQTSFFNHWMKPRFHEILNFQNNWCRHKRWAKPRISPQPKKDIQAEFRQYQRAKCSHRWRFLISLWTSIRPQESSAHRHWHVSQNRWWTASHFIFWHLHHQQNTAVQRSSRSIYGRHHDFIIKE